MNDNLNTYDGYNVSYDGKGYAIICDKNHPNAPVNGIIYVHRLEAEKMLGRKLNHTEAVHHIDGNKANWKIDNLMVFDTWGDHSAFHRGAEAIFDEKTNTYHCDKISHKQYFCEKCGKPTSLKDRLCRECWCKSQRKIERPTKEELTKMILTIPFVKIGEKYNVSDNAIRKWCIGYGLPYKKKDIKQLKTIAV